jgi:hypothetical protein
LAMGYEGGRSVGRGEQGETWKAVGSRPGNIPRRHHALVRFSGSSNVSSLRAAGAPTGAPTTWRRASIPVIGKAGLLRRGLTPTHRTMPMNGIYGSRFPAPSARFDQNGTWVRSEGRDAELVSEVIRQPLQPRLVRGGLVKVASRGVVYLVACDFASWVNHAVASSGTSSTVVTVVIRVVGSVG